MAEELLLAYVRGEISLDLISEWLKSPNGTDNNEFFSRFTCCQQDFIEYFINYIHEDGLGDAKTIESGAPQTPEKAQNKQKNPSIQKRARLQPVPHQAPNWTTSTPKAKQKNLNKSLPNWPQKPNGNQKRPQTKDRSFCLGDFVVKSEKQKKRRIKPTAVEDNPTFKPLQTSFENFVNSGNERQEAAANCLKCNAVELSDVERKQVMLVNRLKFDGNKQDCACVLGISDKINMKSCSEKRLGQVVDIKDCVVQCSDKINTSGVNDKFVKRLGQVQTSLVDKQDRACALEDSVKVNTDSCNDRFENRLGRVQSTFLDEEIIKPVQISSEKQVGASFDVESCIINHSGNISKIEVIPRFEFCRNLPEIDKIAKLFLYFLENSLLVSYTSELHFLLTILVSHHYKDPDEDLDLSTITNLTSQKNLTELFNSPHNRVYFSLEILKQTVNYLHIFDESTLELLFNNDRVQNFGYPEYVKFHESLRTILDYKITERREKSVAVQNFESTDARNVNFIAETDNRDNFVNDASFHAFKKQRDLFYDFFWTWEQRRSSPDWNFAFALGQKVKSLFNLSDDPVNFRQFTRLFVSQLVLVCHRENEGEQFIYNEAAILQKLPGIDSSKLTKLKFRLLVKNDKNGTSTTPNFLGTQEFFREFITACPNAIFHEHLKDAIITELLSQDNLEFSGCDFDQTETIVRDQVKAGFMVKLKKTRILAKFLGYVESLPYQCDYEKLTKKVLHTQLSARKHHKSRLDLKSVILNSIDKKKSIFSICWIVVYLSMIDYVTLRLPYFKKLYEILFEMYKSSENLITTQNISSISYTVLLGRISLGWLFELPYFPSSLYYEWLNKHLISKDCIDGRFKNLWSADECDVYFRSITDGNDTGDFPVDLLDIIDGDTVYTCCPSLERFKTLLSIGQSKYVGEVKRLPLCNVDKNAISQERIERQLESSFLSSRSQPFRKSVEFVSERVCAGCIQYLSNEVLPLLKKDLAAAFEQSIKPSRLTAEDRKHLEEKHTKEIANGLHNITKNMRSTCLEIAEGIVPDRVEKAMFGLLQPDELPLTVKTAGSIAVRMCLRQIRTWVDDALSSAMVEKIVVHELRKVLHSKRNKTSSVLPCNGRPVLHDEKTLSAVEASQNLRNLMIVALEKKPVTEDSIRLTLLDCKQTISRRCDVNNNITLCVHKQTVDFFLILVCFQLELSEILLPEFIDYWLDYIETKVEIFNCLICPRNIRMLSESMDIEKSWKLFEKFLLTLHRNKLLSIAVLEEQCLRIYKHEWDGETLKRISSCYRNLIDNIKESRETFDGLISFMSNFTIDLDTF